VDKFRGGVLTTRRVDKIIPDTEEHNTGQTEGGGKGKGVSKGERRRVSFFGFGIQTLGTGGIWNDGGKGSGVISHKYYVCNSKVLRGNFGGPHTERMDRIKRTD